MATHQDLSGYFFARCVELYLRTTGTIAFVMPYAAMSRRQYAGFRSGAFRRRAAARGRGRRGAAGWTTYAMVEFRDAWALADAVQPLFPVPSCVLFAERRAKAGRALPARVRTAAGNCRGGTRARPRRRRR